jgi:hypothetical protein
MLEIVVILLVLLFLTGNVKIIGLNIPDYVLMTVNGQPITLWNLLTLLIVVWALGLLPSPFREIVGVILVLWLLSIFGILAITGLSNILVVALILGIILSMVKKR